MRMLITMAWVVFWVLAVFVAEVAVSAAEVALEARVEQTVTAKADVTYSRMADRLIELISAEVHHADVAKGANP